MNTFQRWSSKTCGHLFCLNYGMELMRQPQNWGTNQNPAKFSCSGNLLLVAICRIADSLASSTLLLLCGLYLLSLRYGESIHQGAEGAVSGSLLQDAAFSHPWHPHNRGAAGLAHSLNQHARVKHSTKNDWVVIGPRTHSHSGAAIVSDCRNQ